MNSKEIKLFWWRGQNFTNFGDEMNPFIVEMLTSKKIVKALDFNVDLFAVGSVLHRTQFKNLNLLKTLKKEKIYVWGSGTLEPIDLKYKHKIDVQLVRGPLTAALFKCDKEMIYGDPGLLCSERWNVSVQKKYKWGLIVHHEQYQKEWVKKLKNKESVLFIDITNDNLKEIMVQINQCEFIASSSLHGLIVADSYEIPNYWLWDDNLHRGGDWKFLDYFLSVGRSLKNKTNPNDLNVLDDIYLDQDFSYFKSIASIKSNIISSFPEELK